MSIDPLSVLDGVVLAILVVMMVRGIFIGLIREAFSVAALAAACIAVSYARTPLATALGSITNQGIPPSIAPWIAGGLLVVLSIAVVGILGRGLRRGAHAVGLGWADRIAGGALGTAEGALLAGLVIIGAVWLLGTEAPMVANSYSLRAYEKIQETVARKDIGLSKTPYHPAQLGTSTQRPWSRMMSINRSGASDSGTALATTSWPT